MIEVQLVHVLLFNVHALVRSGAVIEGGYPILGLNQSTNQSINQLQLTEYNTTWVPSWYQRAEPMSNVAWYSALQSVEQSALEERSS